MFGWRDWCRPVGMATPGQGEVDTGGQWSRRRRRQQRSVAYICTLALAATSVGVYVSRTLSQESAFSLRSWYTNSSPSSVTDSWTYSSVYFSVIRRLCSRCRLLVCLYGSLTVLRVSGLWWCDVAPPRYAMSPACSTRDSLLEPPPPAANCHVKHWSPRQRVVDCFTLVLSECMRSAEFHSSH